jgi:hypothetical protein
MVTIPGEEGRDGFPEGDEAVLGERAVVEEDHEDGGGEQECGPDVEVGDPTGDARAVAEDRYGDRNATRR